MPRKRKARATSRRARAPRARAAPVAVPPARPRLGASELEARLAPFAIDRVLHPLVVVGIRGYYLRTLGDSTRNDRGLYDDALFIQSPSALVAFNGNVDPSTSRVGQGHLTGKGMASLVPGAWFVHRFGLHRGRYLALCQGERPVSVLRDGPSGPYPSQAHGINIHRGGITTTGSEGCQTVHPSQWDAFIAIAVDQAKRYLGAGWKRAVIPYVLLERWRER